MDEKIIQEAFLIRENFNEMIMNGHAVQIGRNKYKIKYTIGEKWNLVKVTEAGNELLTDMSVNDFLFHLSNTEKA